MRYLIGVLCAVVIVFGAAPDVANAATVGCGRVTTFVGPNAAGSLLSGDGWVIFVKPDGTSEKVILRAGTQVGTLAGYICIGSEGVYSTGVLAPGVAGYISEPANWVTGTGLYCGTVAANPFTSGQISGPRTLQLGGALSAFGQGIFSVPTAMALPTVGSYLCGRFEVGAPSVLASTLRDSDPGYIVAGLPGTSTASTDSISAISLVALILIMGLALFGLRRAAVSPFDPDGTHRID